jgi:hypothetical protein
MSPGARLTSYSYDAFTGAAKVNLGPIYSHAASVEMDSWLNANDPAS